MRKVFSFLVGLMSGMIVGGGLAIIFTPKSGSELQQEIQRNIDRLIAEGKSAADARRIELETQLESFKQGRPITLQTDEG
jgi:gas vesicle protein